MKHIDFGIDLGTTNSGIGKYENGKVQVLKNPVGLRDILPSVVAFHRGRTLVGDKAREQLAARSGNVYSAFKRKMGTAERFNVNQADGQTTISPADLSALVLKELLRFNTGSNIDSAVITIPASFDTMQSNATKQAGYQAGLSEVVLLQEPVAACLAYANQGHLNIEDEQRWLVYDFGGGTFDVALVYINDRELKVLDNKGNNFLGGVDIDNAFLQEVIVPKLVAATGKTDLWNQLIQKQGDYEKYWHDLSYRAEEAKKQLSVTESAWIEADMPELDIFVEFEVTRAEFERVVKPKYNETVAFMRELLQENKLGFNDIQRIILVGGTTYIPYIKNSLRQLSGTTVDDSTDPTTAVIVGAAYYAGAHPAQQKEAIAEAERTPVLDVKLSFETYTNDLEELIAFKMPGSFSGQFRISRNDGGFDTGLNAFNNTASEFVTLLPKRENGFTLTVYDAGGAAVYTNPDISIKQGLYGVSGQLLPEDICIELDNDKEGTFLEVIFKRNSILPLKKTIYKTFSKSVLMDSDDKVIINVVEGKQGTLPGANLTIGYIELNGRQLEGDLIRGADIEVLVAIDESRGLRVDIYIPSSGQEIRQSFHIAEREVSLQKLRADLRQAHAIIEREIAAAVAKEAYELSGMFQKLGDEARAIENAADVIALDAATEERYRLDERKRNVLIELDRLTRIRDLHLEIAEFEKQKVEYKRVEAYATPAQRKRAEQIIADEKEMLGTADKHVVRKATDELKQLNNKMYLQNDENYIGIFWKLASFPEEYFVTTNKHEELVDAGREAIAAKDYMNLKHLANTLFSRVRPELLAKWQNDAPDEKLGGGLGNQTGLR